MSEYAYIIRRVSDNRLIEAHDELSKAHAERLVEIHNRFFPHDQWKLTKEQV
jgi:hypothetical protein